MHTSLYSVTVPLFVRMLTNLKGVLEKAATHTEELDIDEQTLLQERLYEDMLPFVRQVQMACDNAKGAAARLAGVEVPSFPDTEKTVAELVERIDKTITFVKTISPDQFAGAEERDVILPYFKDTVFDGFTYATEYALPNFYFHAAICYAILRHKGVPLGKTDYLGDLSFRS